MTDQPSNKKPPTSTASRPGKREQSTLDEHLDKIVEWKMAGMSDRAIADNLGYSNSAVSRYTQRPLVKKAIDQAHGEVMKRAVRQLATASGFAVQTLIHYTNPANRDTTPPNLQIQASKIMLETIGVGRLADAADMVGEAFNEQAASSAREKARAIEARIVDDEANEALPKGLRVVGDETA